jgi:catechol 2,3-dioxygenase-like lactoylglutathione lyase family enzyme
MRPALRAAVVWSVLIGASVVLRPSHGAVRAQDAPLVTDFHHVHVNVVDPERSAAFYVTNFNATRVTVAGWPGVKTETGYILYEKVAKPASYEWDTAIWHYGWTSESPIDAYKRIAANGVKFFRVPPPSGHMIDPDNVDVELAVGSNPWTPPPPVFNHVHLQAEHPFCSADWYQQVLGLEQIPGPGRAAGGDCKVPYPPRASLANQYLNPNSSVRAGRVSLLVYPHQRLKAFTQTAVDDQGPLVSTRGHVIDHIALTVKDVRAAVRQLRRQRVTILKDTHNFGTSRRKAAMIEGPDRIAIELLEEERR